MHIHWRRSLIDCSLIVLARYSKTQEISASEVTTLRRYTNLFTIIILLLNVFTSAGSAAYV